MPRNQDTTSAEDQVQPGVPAADVAAAPAGHPLASGPAGDPLAAGLAGRPLTAVPDDAVARGEDAATRADEDRGPAAGPADTGSGGGVPPAEGEWVAGTRRPGQAAQTDRPAQAAPGGRQAGADGPLLPDRDGLRERWLQIQSGFIDDPRASVTEAAGFVGEITTTLVTAVHDRERSLRGAWDSSGDTDTENLRNTLREYRTFFELLIRL